MTDFDLQAIEAAVLAVIDPFNGRPLREQNAVCRVTVDEAGDLKLRLILGYPAGGLARRLAEPVEQAVRAVAGERSVSVSLDHRIVAHSVQQGAQAIEGVRNLIAVASGKGGVGKSTTAVNLALALRREGASVGVLDADVYGPSQPQMLGTREQPELAPGEQRRILPIRAHGLQAMSIGFLVEVDTPMIWRGPMATQALEQMCRDTVWDDLDFLIVDLPPGTGDIQLTLAQRMPVSGALVVTTPQDLALLDAVKALRMFEKVNVPILGIIENMSTHICSQCGHQEPIFGAGGGERMAREHSSVLLGALPLDLGIRQQADGGNPTVAQDPEGQIALAYREIALKMSATLALRGKDYARKFPKISVVND